MKKFFLTLLLAPLLLLAEDWEASLRVGNFYPTSQPVRDIYGRMSPIYQFELAYLSCFPWSSWASVGFTTLKGESSSFDNSTRVNLYPLGLGAKYSFDLSWGFVGYLGVGATYTFMDIKDDSPFVQNREKKGAFGGVARTGVRYLICPSGFVELFFDYFYTRFRFHGTQKCIERNDFEVSALIFGFGAGMEF